MKPTDTAQPANVSDAIADLLIEQPVAEAPKKKPNSDDSSTEPDLIGNSGDDTETDDEDEDESSDTEESTDEGDSDDEPESKDSDTEATWASVLGVDERNIVLNEEGDFVAVKVKVDGEVSEVTVPDLIAGYQNNKNNTNKSKLLSEKMKEVDSTKTVLLTEYKQRLDDVEALTKYIEDQQMQQYTDVDWETLRRINPAEYAARVTDLNLKSDEFARIKSAIVKVREEQAKKYIEEQTQMTSEHIRSEIAKAIDDNPEWAKPEVFKKALNSMSDFMTTYGFTTQEFAEIKDARVLNVIRDAQKYRAGKTVAEKKIAKPLPKFQKPSNDRVAKKTKLEQLTRKAQSAKGHAKRELEVDAIAELLLNS